MCAKSGQTLFGWDAHTATLLYSPWTRNHYWHIESEPGQNYRLGHVSTETFAIYINGAIEIPLIAIITGSATSILLPELTQRYNAGDFKGCLQLWQNAAVKCARIIFPAAVLLFIIAPEFIQTLFSEKYVDSALPFRIYLLMLPARIVIFGAIFIASARNHLVLIRAIIGLALNLALSIILVQKMGYIGAAVATILLVYGWAIPFSMHFVARILHSTILSILPVKRLMPIAGLSLLAAAPIIALPRIDTFSIPVQFFLQTFVFSISIITLYHFSGQISISLYIANIKRKIHHDA